MIQEPLKWLQQPNVSTPIILTALSLLGFTAMTLVTSHEVTLQESTLTEQTLSALGYVKGNITPKISLEVLPGTIVLDYKEPATIRARSNGVITTVPDSPNSYRLEAISAYVIQFEPDGGSIKVIKDRFMQDDPVLEVKGRIAITIYYRKGRNEITPVIPAISNNPQEHEAVINFILPNP